MLDLPCVMIPQFIRQFDLSQGVLVELVLGIGLPWAGVGPMGI